MLTYILLCSLIIFYIIILVHHLSISSQSIQWQNLFVTHDKTLECDLNNPKCPGSYHCYPSNLIPDASNPDIGICVKLQDNLNECNDSTGYLTLHKSSQGYILKCICKYPHLVTQLYDGTDCDIDIACQPHGKLKNMNIDPLTFGECECKFPYINLLTDNGPSCVYAKDKDAPSCFPGVLNDNHECTCPHNFIGSDSLHARKIFKQEYLNQFLGNPKCIPHPCRFNVFNNNELLHTNTLRIKDKVQCFCDPQYGNFGVFLQANNYLNNNFSDQPHHNACANIYETEPGKPVNHRAICFYYYKFFEPQCYLKFKNINPNALNKYLISQQTASDILYIKDIWPNNFFNQAFEYVYKNKISAVINYCRFWGFMRYQCYENAYISMYKIPICNKLENFTWRSPYETFIEYNTIFRYPACWWTDEQMSSEYLNRIILNPLHMLKPNSLNLNRSNGLMIYPDKYNDGHYTVQKYPMEQSDFDIAYRHQGKVPEIGELGGPGGP